MQKVIIDLYSINELNKDAKNRAITEHKNFLVEVYSDSDYDVSFNMTRSKYAKQLTKEAITENIEINDYTYFQDGGIAQTCFYTGTHINAGKHILTLNGVDYDLNGKGLLVKDKGYITSNGIKY